MSRRHTAVWLGLGVWALAGLAPARAQEGVAYHGDQIPPEVEAIYARGIGYLVRSQDAEGSWSKSGGESGPGITGLALLAILAGMPWPFLAHGRSLLPHF